ncbi:MAG: hypothetical protein COA94_06000 [Rickettsiales bacterium]|nr:MAG: hypothetical protein COA94_06000 [Rickettsiales bacterium]
MGLGIVGALIGEAIEQLGDLSRAALAAALRDVAGKVERGELVSDDEIEALRGSTGRIREMLKRAGNNSS